MKSLRVIFIICLCFFLISSVSATDNSAKIDFDGDGKTDIALYREGSRDPNLAPQPSYWYWYSPMTGNWGEILWGRTLDVPAPGDYDGDGKTDVGIYRWWLFDIGDTNEYWLSKSTGGYDVLNYQWESSYYKFNRNYFGDAKTEVAHMYGVNISQDPSRPCFISVFFAGDFQNNSIRKTVGDVCNVNPTPVPGDYNNDGRSDVAVFSNRVFKVWFPPYSPGYTTPAITEFLDIESPVPGDYDGDGKTDFAGVKATNGVWLWRVLHSSNNTLSEFLFGFATDKPVPGDYDGDGKTDVAIYRPSNGQWWFIYSATGTVFNTVFGLPTDTPLASPVIPFDPSS